MNAPHELGLPGVECDVCRAAWGTTQISFPGAPVADLAFLKGRPAVPWSKYEVLRAKVAAVVPELAPMLAPAVGFGRVVEKMRRRWPLPPYFLDVIAGLMVTETLQARATAEKLLRFGDAALLRGPPNEPRYFEADLPLAGAQPPALRKPVRTCPQCGHPGDGGAPGWHRTVIASSIPPGEHAFRFREHSTVVLVDDAVRDLLQDCDPVSDPFEKVTIVS